MNIIGLSCYFHDAAACLVRDGRVVAAAEEERFTRKKHDSGFPEHALRYCLKAGGLTGADLDGVIFYDKPLRKLERAMAAGYASDSCDELMRWHLRHLLHEDLLLTERVAAAIGYQGALSYCDHHLSHAASCFYASPFTECAVLTVDGVGEWATTAQFLGRDRDLTLVREIRYPHSIGLFYSTLTGFLGFEVNEGEYKIMGLASYGQPRYVDRLEKLLIRHEDGSFQLDMSYFLFLSNRERMHSEALVALLGPPRGPGEAVTQYHMDIAASLQSVTEQAMVGLVRSFRSFTDVPTLAMAGGVAHNVVANAVIRTETDFTHIFVQPASGDSGGAIGAALYLYYRQNERGAGRTLARYGTCLGPAYGDDEITPVLDEHGLSYRRLDEAALVARTAALLHKDLVVGWFQGRMEFGPRALGCRSILANPCNPKMKDILNARVKFREEFRPFAPAVLEDRAREYFDLPEASPFMLFTANVIKGKEAEIPAVTHVDGTARVQTVSRDDNPRFYRLIEEFAKLSQVPVVVNTSFNIRGEPIVCTPRDAVNCFLYTDIDFLVIGDYLVSKS